MKKFLLMTAAVVFSLNMSAQVQSTPEVMMKMSATAAHQTSAASQISKAPLKSSADGVIYERPKGTFFMSWTKEGRGSYQSFLFVPALTDILFHNVSTAKGEPVWSITNTSTGNSKTYDAEENGDFSYGSFHVQDPLKGEDAGVSYYFMPTLTINTISYTLAGKNSGKSASFEDYESGLVVDSLRSVALVDPHNGTLYGWGAMSPVPYLYGSGTLNGTESVCVGVMQDYDKPAAPMLIQDVFTDCYSDHEVPIPEGKEITLTFVELDEEGNETDNIIGVMTANSESLIEWTHDLASTEYFTDGMGWQGTILFEQKTTDVFGQTNVEPIIINTPFRIYVEGLDAEGVDVGFGATYMKDSDNKSNDTSFLVKDPATGKISSRHYTSAALSIPLRFSAMYDTIALQDTDEGVYEAPVAGGTVTRAGNADYEAAYVYTAYPWYDNQSNENYFVYVEYAEGDPEWLTYEVDNSYWDQLDDNGNYYALNQIGLQAEALPDGVAGRTATVWVYGPAAACSFVVNQGNVTDGIKAVANGNAKKTNLRYNLAGQQVNSQYKGLVIENGKKIVK